MKVKVFDLQLLVGRESIMGDKPRICIETIETCGKNLYIGTNDCFIHHFGVQEVESNDAGKQSFSLKQIGKKHIGMKKPVLQIKAAKALNHLLVNCDNTLILLSMFDLSLAVSVSSKIKNMDRFCINERPLNRSPFAVEICVAFLRKKILQIYQVYVDRVIPMQEISLPDQPRNFSVDGKYLCCATSASYFLVNFETNTKQELFSIGENKVPPVITKIAHSEFLISASNDLGVFVSSDGTSNRPPLQWSEGVFAASLLQPYVLAIDEEFITVHSLLDQQQKQTIGFQGGILITSCDINIILVSTSKDVFVLTPVPLQSQLDSLINNKQVDEAIALVKLSKRKLSPKQFTILYNRIYCMCGFVKFEEYEFDKALEFFLEGGLDPRELISLYTEVMPAKSDFKRGFPPYHEISDINQVCENDQAKIVHSQEFLLLYLELISQDIFSINLQKENMTDLPKICTGMDVPDVSCLVADLFYSIVLLLALLGRSEELQQFIIKKSKLVFENGILDLVLSHYSLDLVENLKKFGCYHACAMLHFQCGDFDSALKLWHAIASNEVSDSSFPGLAYVAEKLADSKLELCFFWQNAEWILKLDQAAAVQIFTNQKANFDNIKPDDVINFLHDYPDAVIDYLYHLVMVQKIPKEKFHSHLTVLYLDKVLKLMSARNDVLAVEAARSKLQNVLLNSNLYRIPLILGKVSEANLYEEQVILHGKLGEHEKALTILVKNLKDSDACKEYCLSKSEDDFVLRRRLFQILINVYLNDVEVHKGKTTSTVAVVELLNQHPDYFEPEVILRHLPSHWSVTVLSKYLHNTVRVPYHASRIKTIENMLLKAELLRLHREQTRLHSVPVVIHEGRICFLCNRAVNNATFMRYPNGTIVHAHCSRDKHVCPVTGKIFKFKKSSFSTTVN